MYTEKHGRPGYCWLAGMVVNRNSAQLGQLERGIVYMLKSRQAKPGETLPYFMWLGPGRG